ncbi:MAG: cobalt transporter CbiM [Thermoleophilia bacterium]|nr:cobalt transporter CbiM [Thermoleophilia bacterium]
MHIPDGYLSPQTAGGMWAFVVPAWYWAGHKVKNTISARQAPLVAIAAAFSFVIMMFNIPLPGGTTGHAVGATIIAIVVGPWAAVIAISVALVIQAIFFGDGGILAIGANCFNIAFICPVVGYYTYRFFAKGAATDSRRRWLSAGAGAWIGLNVAALFTAIEFGLQGELFTAADGSALYSPYGFSTAIPAMMIPHMLVVGTIEAVMTSSIYVFLIKTNPVLLDNYDYLNAQAAGSYKLKPLIIGIVLLLVCTPLGLLATGTAWGEWGTKEIGEEIGYVPTGMERFAGRWEGFLPEYAFPESEGAGEDEEGATGAGDETGGAVEGGAEAAEVTAGATEEGTVEEVAPVSLEGVEESTPGYLISGVLGLFLVVGVALMATRVLTGKPRSKEQLG